MTPDEIAAVLDRRRRTISAQNAAIGSATRAHSAQAAGLHLPYPIGQRVLDIATGEHGAVVGGAPYGAAAGAHVQVQLPSGEVVSRPPSHVLPRPTPPPARL